MSTTFYVYPTSDTIPSFERLLDVAGRHLNAFLRAYGVNNEVRLSVGMRDEKDRVLPVTPGDPAWWPEDQYAWFHVPGVAGGTDAYCRVMDDLSRDISIGDVSVRREGRFAGLAEESLKVGRYWYFRRSIGQPAIVNVAYGILAASLAELTGGFIDSGDNGWDIRLLPARPDEFLSWYFRPEVTNDPEKREWAERCIKHLPDELTPKTWWAWLVGRLRPGVD